MHAHALVSHRRTHTLTHPCDLLLWLALALLTVCKQSCPGSLWLASPPLIRAPKHTGLYNAAATNASAVSNIKTDNNLCEKVFKNAVNMLCTIILCCFVKSFIQGYNMCVGAHIEVI